MTIRGEIRGEVFGQLFGLREFLFLVVPQRSLRAPFPGSDAFRCRREKGLHFGGAEVFVLW